MFLKKKIGLIKKRIKDFFSDEYGGSIVEYALLIGFALFVFFIIFNIISSIMDWTIGLSDDFFGITG